MPLTAFSACEQHGSGGVAVRAILPVWAQKLGRTVRRAACGLWSRHLVAASVGIAAGILVLSGAAAASPRQPLTVDNFAERFVTPALAPMQFPPFQCKPDARNPAAVVCMNNPRYGGVGANIILMGNRSTGEINYVSVGVANPQLHAEPHSTALAGFYILLTSQVMRVLTPEIGPERAMKILTALQENAHRSVNNIRVDGWVYGAADGALLIFAAQRR